MDLRAAGNSAGGALAQKPGIISEHVGELNAHAERLAHLNERIERSLSAIVGPRPSEVADEPSGTAAANVPALSRVNAVMSRMNRGLVRLEMLAQQLEQLH